MGDTYTEGKFYRDGKEVWRQSGEMDGQVLLSKIEAYL